MANNDSVVFWQDSSKAGYIPVPGGSAVKVSNVGNTLYYKSTSDVTSSSSDGSIATAASKTLYSPAFVITAQNVMTQVITVEKTGISQRGGASFTGWHNIAPAAGTTGNNTSGADGTQWVTSLFVPVNTLVTGIGYLVGGTGGTTKVYAVLYDASGAVIANTSLTGGGATAGTANQQQAMDLTSPANITGPALYYVGVSHNGSGAKIQTVVVGANAGIYAGSVSQTHGTSPTVAAITPPTDFTANKAPFVYLY